MTIPYRQSKLVDEWTSLIGRYPWEWFVTLTFTTDIHPEAADKKYRLWISKLNRFLFGPRWKKKGKSVYWVRAIEYQKRGVLHFHALVSGVANTRRLTWMDEWNQLDETTGYARVEAILSAEAVNRYVCKYVAKDGQIDFSENVPSFEGDMIAMFDDGSGPVGIFK